MRNAAAFVIPLLLAACGASDDTGPGAATIDEKRALADASEMIEATGAATPTPPASSHAE